MLALRDESWGQGRLNLEGKNDEFSFLNVCGGDIHMENSPFFFMIPLKFIELNTVELKFLLFIF